MPSKEYMQFLEYHSVVRTKQTQLTEHKGSFRKTAEELNVSKEVLSLIISLETLEEERKRSKILNNLDECKRRIVSTLEEGELETPRFHKED